MERLRDYFNRRYTVDLPAPTRFNSPFSTSFRREPSMELRLSEGQSSRISCLVKRPILFFVAFRTTSMAGSFVSTRAKRSSKSRYAERMVPKIYLMNGEIRMNNLILDFSHVYCDERIPDRNKIHWIDCSDITECDLYCSGCAADEIWARIKPYGINGIHFLDSGNYHYVTGIITDRIDEDFVLVVFDHHTDMQKPMMKTGNYLKATAVDKPTAISGTGATKSPAQKSP